MVAVCKLERIVSFRAADAIYVWLTAMVPILRLEFGANSVSVTGVQGVSQEDRPLFSEIPGDPLVIKISVWSLTDFQYGAVSPP